MSDLPAPPRNFRRFHPEDVHLTLAFLGPCGEQGAERALQALDVALQTQPRDLVLWNNLACLHAGFDGSRTRVLEPIGFVVDEPSGESYEAWLRSAWRDLFARSSKATSRRSEAAETSQRH